MVPRILWLGAAVLALACTDTRHSPTSPLAPLGPDVVRPAPLRGAGQLATQAALERVAARLARTLREPALRSHLKAALDRSPYRERKLHVQALLAAQRGAFGRAIAQANAVREAEMDADLVALGNLELYLPVPAHRAAWTGAAEVLVATSARDGDAPVAFDASGRRYQLDPDVPPDRPVLALVPAETDFRVVPPRAMYCEGCGPPPGGGRQLLRALQPG